MSNHDFLVAVGLEPGLKMVYEGDGGFIVRGTNEAGFPATWAVPRTTVEDTPWVQLRGVFTGKRPERVLTRMSRVVGYFSAIRNWNRSKLAELRDRRLGNYAL